MSSKKEFSSSLTPQEILAGHHQGDTVDPYLIERHLLLDLAEIERRLRPDDQKINDLVKKAHVKLG